MITVEVPIGSFIIPPQRLKKLKELFQNQITLLKHQVILTTNDVIPALSERGFKDKQIAEMFFRIVTHVETTSEAAQGGQQL